MNFEEVEIFHARSSYVLTEAGDIDLIVAVKIKVSAQLIEENILDVNSIRIEDVFKVANWNLALTRLCFY